MARSGLGVARTPVDLGHALGPARRPRLSTFHAAASRVPVLELPQQPTIATGDSFSVVDLRLQTAELRRRLCADWLSGGLIYLYGGDAPRRNGSDVFHPFRACSHFSYLTGVTEPGFGALLDPEDGSLTLLAPRVPDDAAVWWGGLPSLDDLAEAAGAQRAVYATDLPALLQERHMTGASNGASNGATSGGPTLHVLPHMTPDLLGAAMAAPGAPEHALAALEALRRAADHGTTFNTAFLEPALSRARAHKTEAEIGCLLQASRGSAAGHRAMWQAARHGIHEYQLEAAFVHATTQAGLRQLGYPCIVGAGPNAAVLHYERNDAVVQDGQLVLVDAGAEFRCYTADISRTFPVSGRFTARQRDLHNAVLALQSEGLSHAAVPGADWAEVQAAVRRLLVEQLADLGLTHGSIDAQLDAGVDRVFMPHGLGHFLGLDVHDVSDVGPVPRRLEPGHVITVEPGIYFMPLLLQRAAANPKQAALLNMDAIETWIPEGGVRIEDNVLIQQDGIFNLTEAVGLPKSAADIESAMAA